MYNVYRTLYNINKIVLTKIHIVFRLEIAQQLYMFWFNNVSPSIYLITGFVDCCSTTKKIVGVIYQRLP